MMAALIRKNAAHLSAAEKAAFVNALLEVKSRGIYDRFVHTHMVVMAPAVKRWEPYAQGYRNGAHRGPAFLPWHRQFLLELERELQRVDASVTIPFWDPTEDADPTKAAIWQPDFLGGDGLEADQWRVQDGPFAEKNGRWPVPEYPEAVAMDPPLRGTGLKRQFAKFNGGSGPGVGWDTLPTDADVKRAFSETLYDSPPYWASPFNIGFRNRIEGFITKRGDPSVAKSGPQLHNRVHMWVGGNMVLMTSPDDPAFFLHHAYIDRVWAVWQAITMQQYPEEAPHYAPREGGPPGHNLHDRMAPFNRTPFDVLDIKQLGYTYEDTAAYIATINKTRVRNRSLPFVGEE